MQCDKFKALFENESAAYVCCDDCHKPTPFHDPAKVTLQGKQICCGLANALAVRYERYVYTRAYGGDTETSLSLLVMAPEEISQDALEKGMHWINTVNAEGQDQTGRSEAQHILRTLARKYNVAVGHDAIEVE